MFSIAFCTYAVKRFCNSLSSESCWYSFLILIWCVSFFTQPTKPDTQTNAKTKANLVDQSEFGENESVHEKGTSAGGSIDIFETVDEAIERDEYGMEPSMKSEITW